ncbi:MAG: carbohydrate ABC transporter substrate-binding protein [Akkermansiaceae bacterium]|nr:carbohydrate ABC transporter substrate-binding protein [Akkermansiaceae bacterium]
MIELKGMAWNHSRGFTSVVATAQRFEELNPEVRITWEKRSLQAFADASLEELAAAYDLLVMDHPHVALAAEDALLLPYDDYLSAGFLEDQAEHSVGGSHPSYNFAGKQWTLAIDAATPIATWREDLLAKLGLQVPKTWQDMLAMAAQGHVGFAAIPIDLLMHTYAFCDAHQGNLFADKEQLATTDALTRALETLKEAVSLIDPIFQTLNPIQTAEKMTTSDDVAYCPLGYGYSNYSRAYYAPNRLTAGDVVSYQGKPLRTALGGAGIAVSSKTQHAQAAMRYAGFTASPDVQRGVFYHAGGQPGHRAAWLDDTLNEDTHHFFRNTLATLDRALLRPQYHGYMYFQDHGSPVAHDGITGKASVADTVDKLNAIYRESFNH